MLACQAVAESLADTRIHVTGVEIARDYDGIQTATMYADLEQRYKVRVTDAVRQRARERTLEAFTTRVHAMPGIEAVLRHLTCDRLAELET